MMRDPHSRRAPRGRRPSCPRASWAALAILAGGLTAGAAHAQQPPPPSPEVVPAYAQAIITGTDQLLQQAGCSSCGGGGLPPPSAVPSGGGWAGGAPCACTDDSCGSCQCKPGKKPGACCGGCGACGDSFLGRLGGGFIECICCPDPCYEGVWNYAANAAFFQDTVRPQTYSRIRWDSGHDLTQPERAEYFWAKPGVLGGRGPQNIEGRVQYDQLSMYQEVAAGNFAFFIEATYIGVEPNINPAHSNFGDMNLGTKSLLVDCELWQLAFQVRTYIPTGSSRNGLGTGHTALEPSLLSSVKLSQDTYVQSQVAYWIPVGGDQSFEGAVWHYGASLNHEWCKKGPFALISTAEFNGYTFTDGAVANRALAAVQPPPGANRDFYVDRGAAETYCYLGSGLRVVICDKYDLGFGATFALTQNHFADQLYRTEFRVRY
jgi:hypothetical protein